MMTELRDPLLQTLFNEAKQDVVDEALTAQILAHTRNRYYTLIGGGVLVSLAVLLLAWLVFAMPLLEFAVLVSQFFTNPLVELGEGWLALAFMPVNNIASLSVLLAKASLMAWKKLTGTTLLR
ncbi:MAG: hypothetical protein V2I48_00880 [Xanthomonadales bacterium]|jgi:hypothetical protein|nr:hypothetical protein [Xanthomonadales bacterium]